MKKVNTKVLPGFMELLPEEQLNFNRIKQIIENEYLLFGFTPLDTPVIERSETLLAKAGGETEKQIYRFNKGTNDLSLRFDLTVPLARYVAEHFSNLTFPFRRSHIGKVYRGESPQKGRFREFYQCDIDIIGHNSLSLSYDAEIPSVIYSIFSKLDIGKFTIRVNNRKILSGLMSYLDLADQSADVLRVIDKIDKISREDLVRELLTLGLTGTQIEVLLKVISVRDKPAVAFATLEEMAIDNAEFTIGITELKAVTELMSIMGIHEDYYVIDFSIARGLDYYTGTIYETMLDDYPRLGSVCSGGRYDNLASFYTNEKLPGVGISIGLTRLFYQLNEIGLLPKASRTVADILVVPFGEEQNKPALSIAKTIRNSGINADILLQDMSVKQRFTYANKKGVKYVIAIGENEINSGQYTIQNMETGSKECIPTDAIVAYFQLN